MFVHYLTSLAADHLRACTRSVLAPNEEEGRSDGATTTRPERRRLFDEALRPAHPSPLHLHVYIRCSGFYSRLQAPSNTLLHRRRPRPILRNMPASDDLLLGDALLSRREGAAEGGQARAKPAHHRVAQGDTHGAGHAKRRNSSDGVGVRSRSYADADESVSDVPQSGNAGRGVPAHELPHP